MSKLINRLENQTGAAIVEYTPILALFLLIALPSVQLTGVNLSKKFCEVEAGFYQNITTTSSAGNAIVAAFLPCGARSALQETGPNQSGLV